MNTDSGSTRLRRYVVEKYSRPIIVMIFVWFAWYPIIFARLGINPLLPNFESTLGLSHAQAGLLVTAFMFPYALIQIPAGRISERYGSKKVILLGILGGSLFHLLLWRANSFEIALLVRALTGLCCGFFFVPSVALVNSNVPADRAGRLIGITWTAPFLAQVVLYYFISVGVTALTDWRLLFLIMSLPGLVIVLVTHFSFRPSITEVNYESDEGPKVSFKSELTSRLMLSFFLFNFTTGTISWALQTFIPTYLFASRGFSISAAALFALMYPLGCVPSSVFSGYLKDKMDFRIPVLVSMVLCMICLLLMPLAYADIALICLIFLLGFAFPLCGNPIMIVIMTRYHPAIRGRLLGAFNMMGFFAAAIGPFAFGLAADISFETFFLLLALVLVLPLVISLSLFWRMKSLQ